MDTGIMENALSLLVGNFVGTISDRVITIVDSRIKLIEALKMDPTTGTGSLLDSVLGVFLHVGMLGIGTQFATSALPWITQDASSYTLFMLGVMATSPHLTNHLRVINTIVLSDSVYASERKAQERVLENGPKPQESVVDPASD